MIRKKVNFRPSATPHPNYQIAIRNVHHKRVRSQEELKYSFQNLPLQGLRPPSQRKSICSRKKINTLRTIKTQEKSQKYGEVVALQEEANKEYNQLLKLYETNEWKLRKIVQKQLEENKEYLYSKEVLFFLKNPQFDFVKDLNFDLLKNDLIKLTRFLTEFSAKKKIRQVQILKDSMISRESMIRDSATLGDYSRLYENLRTNLGNPVGYTLYDQLRSIRRSYNLPSNIRQSQENFSHKITEAEQKVYSLIKDEMQSREKVQKEMFGIILMERKNSGIKKIL